MRHSRFFFLFFFNQIVNRCDRCVILFKKYMIYTFALNCKNKQVVSCVCPSNKNKKNEEGRISVVPLSYVINTDSIYVLRLWRRRGTFSIFFVFYIFYLFIFNINNNNNNFYINNNLNQ